MKQTFTHNDILEFHKLERDLPYFINKIYENEDINKDFCVSVSEKINTFSEKNETTIKSMIVSIIKSIIFEQHKVIVVMCKDKSIREFMLNEIYEKSKNIILSSKCIHKNKSGMRFESGILVVFCVMNARFIRGRAISSLYIIADKIDNKHMEYIYPSICSLWSSTHIAADEFNIDLDNWKKI